MTDFWTPTVNSGDVQSHITYEAAIKTLSWLQHRLHFISRQNFEEALYTLLRGVQQHLVDSRYAVLTLCDLNGGRSNQYMARRVQHFLPPAEAPETDTYTGLFAEDRPIRYVRQYQNSGEYYKILILDDGSFSGSQAQGIIKKICREMNQDNVPQSARIEVIIAYVACSGTAKAKIEDEAKRDIRIQLVFIPAPIRVMSIQEATESEGRTLEEDLKIFQISFDDLNAWTAAIFRPSRPPIGPDLNPLGDTVRAAWEFPRGADMHTTVLPHKVPDDVSLLWSTLLREGLDRQGQGGVLCDQSYSLYNQWR